MNNPYYYISKYKIVRINILLFFLMFITYYCLFIFSPDILHTHVAIGDITPKNYILKLIVSFHIIIVFVTTCISLVEDQLEKSLETNYHLSTRTLS